MADTETRELLQGVARGYFGPKPDATQWIQQKLRTTLWSGQQRVLDSLRSNRYTVVPSAHDLGKSFLAAAIACQWLEEHDLGDAFVVSTAPTSAQVSAVLWREIEKLHRRGSLRGQINMGRIPEWKIGKELVGYGRKPSDYDETGFQGIHCRYPLIIIDEAAGIPEQLWTAVDALATNENARVLAIGNPDDQNSQFRAMCLPGSGWHIVRLDGLSSPNFTEVEVRAASKLPSPNPTGDLYSYMVDNKIPFATEKIPFDLQQLLLSPRWVAERMVRWNVYKDSDGAWQTSSLWESRVRGRFPSGSATDGVIPLSWVEAAVDRWNEWEASGIPVSELVGYHVFSCDVARFGEDETAVSERVGMTVLNVERVGQQDTMTTANRLDVRLKRHSQSTAIVDVIGVGGGVVDRLREMGHDVIAFNSAASTDMRTTDDEFGFPNVRSAAWWNLRELLDPSNPSTTIALPDDENLIADLISPKWRVAAGAKIVVEPKDETKKRIRRSPDTGDSVVMSFWHTSLGSVGSFYATEYGGASDYVAGVTSESEYLPTFGDRMDNRRW
jgi:hypothetical protein